MQHVVLYCDEACRWEGRVEVHQGEAEFDDSEARLSIITEMVSNFSPATENK